MGTWGPGIFDSDLALDVRHAFRERVAAGADGAKAAGSLLRDWNEGFEDHEDGSRMWFALAAAAWEAGRLPASVKAMALKLIATAGTEWESGVLEKLKQQLQKKPPAPKRISAQKKHTTELEPGHVIAYRLPSRHVAVLRVASISVDAGGATPVLELLDWVKKSAPTAAQLEQLSARLTRLSYDPWGRLPCWFYVDLARKTDPGRRWWTYPEKLSRPEGRGFGPVIRVGAKLEAKLADELRLRSARASR